MKYVICDANNTSHISMGTFKYQRYDISSCITSNNTIVMYQTKLILAVFGNTLKCIFVHYCMQNVCS